MGGLSIAVISLLIDSFKLIKPFEQRGGIIIFIRLILVLGTEFLAGIQYKRVRIAYDEAETAKKKRKK
jgi:hypothetical protein